ncbi:MAG: prolyl oligopeptidase family serine peptidase [Proteobacteria bacterium]|nr:prolyl oligopeptidase family serine peptidase [Pseudomonadota bacterium]
MLKSNYPATRRENILDIIHERPVPDPYRWLENATDPEVQQWMTAQDKYARAHLQALPGREQLRARLEELSYIDSASPPVQRNNKLFYWRRNRTQEKSAYCMVETAEATTDIAERVLIDPNRMSENGSVSVHEAFPSRDGSLLAYKRSENNADDATLHIIDVISGQELETIPGAMMASPSWTPDSRGFYYVRLPEDPTVQADQLVGYAEVRFHAIGNDPTSDQLIVGSTNDASVYIEVQISYDGNFLWVTHHRGWGASDIYFCNLESDHSPIATGLDCPIRGFATLISGRDAIYWAYFHCGQIYILSNEAASRYRVFRADPARPERSSWREIVAASDATLQAAQIIGDHLVLSYLRNAHSAIVIHDLDGGKIREVELPGTGTVTELSGTPDDDVAYFAYSSFVEAPEIYRLSVPSGNTSLWRRIDVPADTSDMIVEQVWYPSRDGTEISMFIVRRDDIALDGNNPVLLTGYGGFSIAQTPTFSTRTVLWLEQGGIHAVPNLRGGGEYGEEWHRAGMRNHKQNVFDDFIAAAEYLIDSGYTRAEKLAIVGRSNGGLLVGATMVQRPDLMAAVVCGVPLLDMIRYHRFGRGRMWIPEYGSAENEEEMAVLWAYSPYHRVRNDVLYPALLMLSADSDDRVDPMHARKFTAQLQASVTSVWPALLRVENHAGHGGGDSIRQAIELDADTYAFIAHHLGLR